MTPQAPAPRRAGAQLRDELVAAAREMLLAPRLSVPFSLRSVAKSVGVSPTAVYRHFASVQDLVSAVVDDHNVLLGAAVGAPAGEPTVEALTALGVRYAAWGIANPGAYELLFESADRFGHPVGPGTPGWQLIDQLAAWLRPVAGDDAPVLAIRAWVQLHGLTSLRVHKPTLPWPTTLEHEVGVIAAALLAGRPAASGA